MNFLRLNQSRAERLRSPTADLTNLLLRRKRAQKADEVVKTTRVANSNRQPTLYSVSPCEGLPPYDRIAVQLAVQIRDLAGGVW